MGMSLLKKLEIQPRLTSFIIVRKRNSEIGMLNLNEKVKQL